MKVIFQGEVHTSKSDWESLNSRIDDGVDALFIEQRDATTERDYWGFGYLYFLLGIHLIYWIQAVASRAPADPEYKLPVHDEIDLTLPEVYDVVPTMWRFFATIVALLFFLAGVFVPVYPAPFVDNLIATLFFTLFMKPLAILGSPLIYSFILIIVEELNVGARDQRMADEINRISNENGYETVVVSCGDAHLKRLPKLMKEDGWEIDTYGSNHGWLVAPWRWI